MNVEAILNMVAVGQHEGSELATSCLVKVWLASNKPGYSFAHCVKAFLIIVALLVLITGHLPVCISNCRRLTFGLIWRTSCNPDLNP